MSKIVILVFITIGAIIVAVVRAIIHFISKTSQVRTIAKIKKDPSKADAVIAYLDIMIERKPDINEQQFNLIKAKLLSSPAIGSYKVLHAQEINEHQLLLFTELTFEDFDVVYKETTIDVQKKAHHNFLFQHNKGNNELELYSNLPVDATDKFQKKEFLQALYQSA